MSEHFNNLSPAQAERLAVLIEELNEASQAACKILRHGYNRRNPHEPSFDNRYNLEKELGHARNAISMLIDAGDIASLVPISTTRSATMGNNEQETEYSHPRRIDLDPIEELLGEIDEQCSTKGLNRHYLDTKALCLIAVCRELREGLKNVENSQEHEEALDTAAFHRVKAARIAQGGVDG